MLSQSLSAGLQHHAAGRLAEAEAFYRQILRLEPRHPDALHLLGVVALQRGDPDAAIDLIGQAIAGNGAVAMYHVNIGAAFRALGRLDQAMASYDRALALMPNLAEAHNGRGNVLRTGGDLAAALAAYEQALTLEPDFAEAHNNVAGVRLVQGDHAAALASAERALALKPDFAEAKANLTAAREGVIAAMGAAARPEPAAPGASEQDCFERLQVLIREQAVSLVIDADFLDHMDSPVAVEADSNIWAYGLIVVAGALFWYAGLSYGLGAAVVGTALYFTVGRLYVRRRLRRRVERDALGELDKWRKLWRFGGVTLRARAAAQCAAPAGSWIEFVRRQPVPEAGGTRRMYEPRTRG